MRNKIRAFTLSEVLLVLSVIGVVAALTIPTLIQKTQEQDHNAALKKMYAELSQATVQLQNPSSSASIPSTTDATEVRNAFSSVMRFIKTDTAVNIWGEVGAGNPASKYRNYKGTAPAYMHLFGGGPAAVLANGTFIGFASSYRVSNGFHEIYVDTNGSKGPNMQGVDVNKFLLMYIDGYYKCLPVGADGANWGPMTNCAANSVSYSTSWPCTALRLTNPDKMP